MIYTLTLNPALDRELSVPAIEPNTVLRATHSRADFGGKGFNVSRMIASLGGESVAVGFVGGKTGEILQEGLQSLDIQTEFVWLEGETRTNVSIVTDGQYIKVNESGPTVSEKDLDTLLERITSLTSAGDWWVLSGSLPPGVPVDIYGRITSLLRGLGAKVFLDSSKEALRRGCLSRPGWVKPNLSELKQVTSQDDPIQAMREMQSWGAERIAVTLGDEGALLLTEQGLWHGISPTIVERNPIGAGDAFIGGVVWASSQGEDEIASLQWGLACGAATASLSGTQVGSREQVVTLKPQVKVRNEVGNE